MAIAALDELSEAYVNKQETEGVRRSADRVVIKVVKDLVAKNILTENLAGVYAFHNRASLWAWHELKTDTSKKALSLQQERRLSQAAPQVKQLGNIFDTQ